LMFALAQASKNIFEWWLSRWTQKSTEGRADVNDFHFVVYASLGALTVVISLLRSVGAAMFMLRSGVVLHEQLLCGVIRAPTSFFDVTPSTHILNRFSKDMDNMDTQFHRCFPIFLLLSFEMLGLVLTIGVTMPAFFIPLVLIAACYFEVSRRFRPCGRDLQSLESVSRSPLFEQLSETLSGISTIRAFGDSQRFVARFYHTINDTNRAFFTIHNANRWMQLRLELLGSVLFIAVAFLSLQGRSAGSVSASEAGLAMYYAQGMAQMLNFAVRMASETEARMESAERIREYAKNIESEASSIMDMPPDAWPSCGRIEIQDVYLRYRQDLPQVLQGLSVKIEGGSKVGICGKPGCGKSSIFHALFRVVDIASSELGSGTILVDGADVSRFSLDALRRAIGIVPQDLVLFSGSVRDNLDLRGNHGNDEIWHALHRTALQETVRQLPSQLEASVQDGGGIFSRGQGKLICVARALLRRPRILCLDEALDYSDAKVDAIIQEVIKNELVNSTVLRVACKLNTIAYCERIIFIEDGRMVEFDTPGNLLKLGSSGRFAALVRELRGNTAHQRADDVETLSKSASSAGDMGLLRRT